MSGRPRRGRGGHGAEGAGGVPAARAGEAAAWTLAAGQTRRPARIVCRRDSAELPGGFPSHPENNREPLGSCRVWGAQNHRRCRAVSAGTKRRPRASGGSSLSTSRPRLPSALGPSVIHSVGQTAAWPGLPGMMASGENSERQAERAVLCRHCVQGCRRRAVLASSRAPSSAGNIPAPGAGMRALGRGAL